MHLRMLVALVVTLYTSLVHSAQIERMVDIFAWPLSQAKSQTLAQITYTSSNATVKSHKAPKIPTGDDVVRIGFYHKSGEWSGVATAASNFAPGKDKKVLLHLNTAGELYHVGFKASDVASSSRTGKAQDGLGVEVVKMQPGPMPHLNKPVVVNADGQEEGKVVEKTFLQKYWWVIGGLLVVQIAMGAMKE